MILLDTNVISELMKSSPMPCVLNWINQQQNTDLVISTITLAEITYGLQVLPLGNRRIALESAFDKAMTEAFQHRILSFNDAAAYYYGEIMGKRKQLGRPMSVLDGQIAAIALSHGAAVATRNINDFMDCGLMLMNPFTH